MTDADRDIQTDEQNPTRIKSVDSVLIAALQVLCEEEKSNQVAFFFKKWTIFAWNGKVNQVRTRKITRYDLFPECN